MEGETRETIRVDARSDGHLWGRWDVTNDVIKAGIKKQQQQKKTNGTTRVHWTWSDRDAHRIQFYIFLKYILGREKMNANKTNKQTKRGLLGFTLVSLFSWISTERDWGRGG